MRVQPRNRMRENCTSGSVRGAPGNRRSYRATFLYILVRGYKYMKIEDYLTRLNNESQGIFKESLRFKDKLGASHHRSACIYEFSQHIVDTSEREILKTVSAQLESATLCACKGMYRQAFVSLRLALEMGLAAAHFSAHKLELQEWLNGRKDIKWSTLIDENDGVISARFAKAFFNEFSGDVTEYRNKAIKTYRKLSEFVHGNSETWESSEIELSFNEDRLSAYFDRTEEVSEIILFVLSCRYLQSFSESTLETIEFIHEEMKHIEYIRVYFGGPKDSHD